MDSNAEFYASFKNSTQNSNFDSTNGMTQQFEDLDIMDPSDT